MAPKLPRHHSPDGRASYIVPAACLGRGEALPLVETPAVGMPPALAGCRPARSCFPGRSGQGLSRWVKQVARRASLGAEGLAGVKTLKGHALSVSVKQEGKKERCVLACLRLGENREKGAPYAGKPQPETWDRKRPSSLLHCLRSCCSLCLGWLLLLLARSHCLSLMSPLAPTTPSVSKRCSF